MATVSIDGIAIRGISACVPKNTERNADLSILTTEEIQKFIDATGIEERRIATEATCTSDLCVQAGDDLLDSLAWDRNSVELIVVVSQTGDYILPVSATMIQDRLQLSKDCIAFDMPLGCSGYAYGMSVVTGMMKSFGLKRGLLLVGDTLSKWVSKEDKSTFPLFGDAASCTAFEMDASASKIYFDLGTDGSGFESIIIRDGGSRNKTNAASLIVEEFDTGIKRNKSQLALDGMEVFSFGISQAPKTINKLFDTFSIDKDVVDHFVFHQANMMMNKMIVKKLKLPIEKVPFSLKHFGNTSSATIPLTIVTELKEALKLKDSNVVLCGFGVGLSWGSVYLQLQKETHLIFSEYV